MIWADELDADLNRSPVTLAMLGAYDICLQVKELVDASGAPSPPRSTNELEEDKILLAWLGAYRLAGRLIELVNDHRREQRRPVLPANVDEVWLRRLLR